jgi:predicted XRE-type DNA-binding protein
MKVQAVRANNRKKCFEVRTRKGTFSFPYSKLHLRPSANDPLLDVKRDPEIGNEGFTYHLQSGREDTVLLDQVLEYQKNPDYLREMLLFKLSVQATKVLEATGLAKREVMRRLGTSQSQLYRLLDPTNKRKSLDEMVRLLAALDCDVDLTFKEAA